MTKGSVRRSKGGVCSGTGCIIHPEQTTIVSGTKIFLNRNYSKIKLAFRRHNPIIGL